MRRRAFLHTLGIGVTAALVPLRAVERRQSAIRAGSALLPGTIVFYEDGRARGVWDGTRVVTHGQTLVRIAF